MFINLTTSDATLEDIDNFKAFKVTTALPPAEIGPALAGIGHADATHAWIDPAWLETNGRANDAAWLHDLSKMLDYAKRAGWVDEHGHVRAHIES